MEDYNIKYEYKTTLCKWFSGFDLLLLIALILLIHVVYASRKHAYSNSLKILQLKKENFQIKKILIFFILHLKTQIVGTR